MIRQVNEASGNIRVRKSIEEAGAQVNGDSIGFLVTYDHPWRGKGVMKEGKVKEERLRKS